MSALTSEHDWWQVHRKGFSNLAWHNRCGYHAQQHRRNARARKDAELQAVGATAAVLDNTAPVARQSYIDPRVLKRYAKGELLDLTVSSETAIRSLLGGP